MKNFIKNQAKNPKILGKAQQSITWLIINMPTIKHHGKNIADTLIMLATLYCCYIILKIGGTV